MFRTVHYLRGVAAVSVVVLHARDATLPAYQLLSSGVDLFFLISGFVMYAATAGRRFDARDFAWRRFVRVMPLWWIASALYLGLVIGSGAAPYPGLAETLGSFLLVPYSKAPEVVQPFLGVGWTLIFEAQFYVLFTVAMALGRWRAALVAVLLASLFSALFLGFAAGLWLAHLTASGRRFSPWLAVVGGLLLVAVSFVDQTETTRGLLRVPPLLMIFAGVLSLEGRLPHSALLHMLGSASYSIYLFHLIPRDLLMDLRGEGWVPLLAVSLGFGIACHYAIERPVLRLLRPRTALA